MKKLPYFIVLLQGLFLGCAPANAKQPPTPITDIDKLEQQSKIWVIGDQKQPRQEQFTWIVKDLKKAGQQPFLQVLKDTAKPVKKPKPTVRSGKNEELEPFSDVVKDTKKQEGLFTLYRQKDKNKVFLEIKPEQLNKNYISLATMESGIGERGVYSGMPLQDLLFYFRRVNNNLQFVVRNVNFRTNEGDPQARSVARSFSDSVIYSLPIKSIHPQRQTMLIDLGDLLLTDLAGLSSSLTAMGIPYRLDDNTSYFGNVKAFPENIEIESIYGLSGGANKQLTELETVPDNRAFTLRVHYSISQLPEKTHYQPRLADDRVGYFISAYQDLSNDNHADPFIRYINRWHLEKQNPNVGISPPKKPIVFWIDNAVPLQYRTAIKEGVLMWNQAFEKAGFQNAIQVQQMPDNATWDPADIRYNTIRWINTVDGYFAMGPSRVNPLTGEILNATILVDASFIRKLKQEYRNIVEQQTSGPKSSLSALIDGHNICGLVKSPHAKPSNNRLARMAGEYDVCYGMELANQFAVGSMALTLFQNAAPNSDQVQNYIHDYLRLIISHEVGHTLGLRHNFRGSTLLKPNEMNNTEITHSKGLTTSVMDYLPPNLAPPGVKQGDYFPSKVGPYDDWAIKYGYMPSSAKNPMAEKGLLEEIASQSTKPELTYAPDEDSYDMDPTVNRWDNSGDVLVYSQWQLDNDRLMWDRLNKSYPIKGESYSDLSERFDTVFMHYLQNTHYITKYIGGQIFSRNHADGSNKLPFTPVPVEKQRLALAALQKYIFASDAFTFAPELLNKLAPSRWLHWGSDIRFERLDYPVHDSIFLMQSLVLRDLLSADRITRLRDIELKSQPGQALTLPELFDTLQNGIWSEVLQPHQPLKISSLRRAVQREYLNILTGMVLRTEGVPEDAKTLAWYKLRQLENKLKNVNSRDEYTQAHLLETRDRIKKTLNAQVQSN